MNDLISRAAAHEMVKGLQKWCITLPGNPRITQVGYMSDDVRFGLDRLPAVDAVPVVQQWISVKDRLPVNLGTVIVANKAGVSFAYFNGAYWERGAATRHKPIKTITHWMPLPEPPKMDGDADG